MAYADTLRTSAATLEIAAGLIEGIGSSTYPLTWTAWTPTYTGGGGTWAGSGTAKYIQIGKLVLFWVAASATLSGTTAYLTYTLPPVSPASALRVFASAWILPDAANVKSGTTFVRTGTTMQVQRYDGSNLTAGVVAFDAFGFYEAA